MDSRGASLQGDGFTHPVSRVPHIRKLVRREDERNNKDSVRKVLARESQTLAVNCLLEAVAARAPLEGHPLSLFSRGPCRLLLPQ